VLDRVASLNRHLKRYDSSLYCEWGLPKGVMGNILKTTDEAVPSIHILRKNRQKPHEPHFIFALTENWSAKSPAREWGIEVVLNRLKAMDLWKNETIVDRVMKETEDREVSERREVRSSIEDFLKEFRGQFAKSTNHINTSTLNKVDSRRQGDLKYGH
jgi:hypothetical protein